MPPFIQQPGRFSQLDSPPGGQEAGGAGIPFVPEPGDSPELIAFVRRAQEAKARLDFLRTLFARNESPAELERVSVPEAKQPKRWQKGLASGVDIGHGLATVLANRKRRDQGRDTRQVGGVGARDAQRARTAEGAARRESAEARNVQIGNREAELRLGQERDQGAADRAMLPSITAGIMKGGVEPADKVSPFMEKYLAFKETPLFKDADPAKQNQLLAEFFNVAPKTTQRSGPSGKMAILSKLMGHAEWSKLPPTEQFKIIQNALTPGGDKAGGGGVDEDFYYAQLRNYLDQEMDFDEANDRAMRDAEGASGGLEQMNAGPDLSPYVRAYAAEKAKAGENSALIEDMRRDFFERFQQDPEQLLQEQGP